MRVIKSKTRLPSTLVAPLCSEKMIVSWISELTRQSEAVVLSRLRREYEKPGINETRAFAEAGLQQYVWSSELGDFYGQTDAFLYELAIWNCNRLKLRMRKWLANYLSSSEQRRLNILCIGDGLGFDSAYLAQLGHNVTYFELPGYTEAFARKVIAQCAESITILTDRNQIPLNKYDAVICLDVLEHIHDPNGFIDTIAGYLRPGGTFIVHAPFYMIHPTSPTHLKSNRRYCGSLSLYEKHNFKLVDGEPNWNPLVFEKITNSSTTGRDRRILKLIIIRLAGLYFALGRFSILPFLWIKSYRLKHRNWFGAASTIR